MPSLDLTAPQAAELTMSSVPEPLSGHLYGWRLGAVTASVCLVMFIVNVEVSIVATALVSIANDLHGYDQVSWVVTSYLVTYTSLIIIWSKFSNAFGRKTSMISALVIFTTFSGGCGGAQTMTQLIIFRAMQGIGAAGCFSLALTITYEMVPQDKYPKHTAIFSAVIAMGSVAGPLIGGAFSEKASWRGIFLFPVPLGAVVCVLLFLCIPNGFPHHNKRDGDDDAPTRTWSWNAVRTLDLLGAICLLGASLLLVTALLEAGVTVPWRSATTITLLTLSGLLWMGFVLQAYRLFRQKEKVTQPIFPWEFFKNRAWMGTLLLSMLSGAPYIVAIVDIPQRFQVNGVDPISTGVRLIPFNLSIALGTTAINLIITKVRTPPIYFLLLGVMCQTTGVTLLSNLSTTSSVSNSIYGYEVLTGLGIGFVFGICFLLPPAVANHKDLALCAGAVLQFRMFGAALGLAIGTNIMNDYAKRHLQHLLPPDQLLLVLQSTEAITRLPADVRLGVKEVLISSFNQRIRVLIGFAALQFFVLGMLWRTPQIAIPRKEDKKDDVDVNDGVSGNASSTA